MGALGTGWIFWLRREGQRDTAELASHGAALAAEVHDLRVAVDSLRLQIVALRCASEAARAEVDSFIHGPPSVRRPPVVQ
jgi:hypothetical protein